MIGDLWDEYAGTIMIGGGALLLLGLLYLLIMAQLEEDKKCVALSGHMISKTGTVIGPAIGKSGGVAVTTTTVRFCISEDGRILF